jgi:hypothetical protein
VDSTMVRKLVLDRNPGAATVLERLRREHALA